MLTSTTGKSIPVSDTGNQVQNARTRTSSYVVLVKIAINFNVFSVSVWSKYHDTNRVTRSNFASLRLRFKLGRQLIHSVNLHRDIQGSLTRRTTLLSNLLKITVFSPFNTGDNRSTIWLRMACKKT